MFINVFYINRTILASHGTRALVLNQPYWKGNVCFIVHEKTTSLLHRLNSLGDLGIFNVVFFRKYWYSYFLKGYHKYSFTCFLVWEKLFEIPLSDWRMCTYRLAFCENKLTCRLADIHAEARTPRQIQLRKIWFKIVHLFIGLQYVQQTMKSFKFDDRMHQKFGKVACNIPIALFRSLNVRRDALIFQLMLCCFFWYINATQMKKSKYN